MDQGRLLRALALDGQPIAGARVRSGAGLDWIALGATDGDGELVLPDRLPDREGFVQPRYLSVEHAGHVKVVVRDAQEAVQVVRLEPGSDLIGQLRRPQGLREPFGEVRVLAWPDDHGVELGPGSDFVARIDADPALVEAEVDASGAFRLTDLDSSRTYSLRAIGGGWISKTTGAHRPGEEGLEVHLSQVYLLCMETDEQVSLLLNNKYESNRKRVLEAELKSLKAAGPIDVRTGASIFGSQTDRKQLASGIVPLPELRTGFARSSRGPLTAVSPNEAAWFCQSDLGHRDHKLVFGYGDPVNLGSAGPLTGEFLVQQGQHGETLHASFASVKAGGAIVSLRDRAQQAPPVYRVDLRIKSTSAAGTPGRRGLTACATFLNTADSQDVWMLESAGTNQPSFWLPAGSYELLLHSPGGFALSNLIKVEVSEHTPPVVIDWTHLGSIEMEWVDEAGMSIPDALSLICYETHLPATSDSGGRPNAIENTGGVLSQRHYSRAPYAPMLTLSDLPPATYRIEFKSKRGASVILGGVPVQSVLGNPVAFNVVVRAGEVARVQVVSK